MEDKIKELGKRLLFILYLFTVDNSENFRRISARIWRISKKHGIKDYRVAKTPNSNYNFIVKL